MQPQSLKNIKAQQSSSNSSTSRVKLPVAGNTRIRRQNRAGSSRKINGANSSTPQTNQPAVGDVYQQNYLIPPATDRHAIQPAMHQNVALEQFPPPYASKIPHVQPSQFSPQLYPQIFYPCYVQQPSQQVVTTTVYPIVGSSLSNPLPVQTVRSSNSQITLSASPQIANAVFSAGNTTSTQPMGTAPLIIRPQEQPLQNSKQTKSKLRSHALQIIHPVTDRNILDDLNSNKNGSAAANIVKSLASLVQPVEMSDGKQKQKAAEVTINLSPIQMSPLQTQDQNTKKSSSAAVKQHKQNICQDICPDLCQDVCQDLCQGKMEENMKQILTTAANSICFQQSLATNCILQEEEDDRQQEENISPKISDEIIFHQKKESKGTFTEEDFNTEKEKFIPKNFMQPAERETLTLAGQKEMNSTPSLTMITNEKHQQQQEKRKMEYSNQATSDVISNNSFVNSTNNHKYNIANENTDVSQNTTDIKNANKLEKNNEESATSKKTGAIRKGGYKASGSNKSYKASQGIENSSIAPKEEQKNSSIPNKYDTNQTESDNSSEAVARNLEKDIEDNTAPNYMFDGDNFPYELPLTYRDHWSPATIGGKKQYKREQLMQLREHAIIISQGPKLTLNFPYCCHNKTLQSIFSGQGGCTRTCSSNNKQKTISNVQHPDSGHYNRNSDKSIIHLNLSLNQEVQLNEADNAWRPRVLVEPIDTQQLDPEQKAQREQEQLIRRVRGILNKLTPENFETLVEEIFTLKIDTAEKMKAVMILVFEKAIDEPNFSVSYASLCHRLISEVQARDARMTSGTKINLASFRKALLDKTELEFVQNVTKSNAKEEKLKPIKEQIRKCQDVNDKLELENLLNDEERRIRRRSGGTVRFIGELFRISILTGKIINSCIEALLKHPNNEDMLECLCKLLTTVGQKFEETAVNKNDVHKFSLESVIQRMQNISSKSEKSKISSRVRFMLQDVIDLRKRKWQTTRSDAATTMQQIEKEAEQLNIPYQYKNTTIGSSFGGKRDDPPGASGSGTAAGGPAGGSNARRSQCSDIRNFKRQRRGIAGGNNSQPSNATSDDKWHIKTGKGNRSLAVDTSKLVGMSVDLNNKKMGGASLFQWNNVQSQSAMGSANSFAVLSLDSSGSSFISGTRNKSSYSSNKVSNREYSTARATQGDRTKHVDNLTSSKIVAKNAFDFYQDIPKPSLNLASNEQHQQQHDIKPAASELAASSAALPQLFIEPTNADLKLFKTIVLDIIENAGGSQAIDDTIISAITTMTIKENQLCGLVYYILTDYLHLGNVGTTSRRYLGNVMADLINKKYLTIEHFRSALTNFAKLASELIIDIPELWQYIFEFTAPLIAKKLLTLNDFWTSELNSSDDLNIKRKFLKTFLQYCTQEMGPRLICSMWKQSRLKWTDFMAESEVRKFIESNNFQYVENESCQPPALNESKKPKINLNKRVMERIEQLLRKGAPAHEIIDYINGNIVDIDKSFIRKLTNNLISGCIIKDSRNYRLDIEEFRKSAIAILVHYLDSKKDLHLECLDAIQLLVHNLANPKDLLLNIFAELNNANVIDRETFIKWRHSKGPKAGNALALTLPYRFFNDINGGTSEAYLK